MHQMFFLPVYFEETESRSVPHDSKFFAKKFDDIFYLFANSKEMAGPIVLQNQPTPTPIESL